MNEALAQYLFLPWVRQGLATRIQGPVSAGSRRAGFQVRLEVSKDDSPEWLNTNKVELYGPADVTGFEASVVVRTDPKDNVGDFEPNYFPAIEFAEADFPWRYSPLAVQEGYPHRLLPWIRLIVLQAEGGADGGEVEFEKVSPAGEGYPPAIEVTNCAASLPDPGESWAWAHAQLTTTEEELLELVPPGSDGGGVDGDKLRDIMRNEPERVVSRLLCPRRLKPGVKYRAFVVPTFLSGAKAGRKESLDGVEADDFAWDSTDNSKVTLPYYYEWEFRTGLRGDFEYLVRLLEGRKLDSGSGVGKRDIDCFAPGYRVGSVVRTDTEADDSNRHVLALEGALVTTDFSPTPWPGPGGEPDDGFRATATELLNLPEEQLSAPAGTPSDVPLVVPPIYGRWHALRKKLPGWGRKWLNTLNLDPRYRTIAGFGTTVVQKNQEEYMAEAWRQVGAVNEANEAIRRAQLGRAASERIYRRHLQALPRDLFNTVTAPLHARVLMEATAGWNGPRRITVKHFLNQSRIPSAVWDGSFRRISRSGGPRRKRQREDKDPNRASLIERLNSGEVAAAGDLPFPGGAPGLGVVTEAWRPLKWAKGWLWSIVKKIHLGLLIVALLVLVIAAVFFLLGAGGAWVFYLALGGSVLLVAALILGRIIAPGYVAENVREDKITADTVRKARLRPGFRVEDITGSDFSLGGVNGDDEEKARAFKIFAEGVQAFLGAGLATRPPPAPIDLDEIRRVLLGALDPRKTVAARVRRRFHLAGVLRGGEDLETIMAAPEFHQPMYEALRDVSQDYFLPGVEKIPQNTMAVLETNQRFVEAFLGGAIFEGARELLYREYPTDQRGSYFRQFWDVSGVTPGTTLLNEIGEGEAGGALSFMEKLARARELLREALKDIKPLHLWRNNDLGGNNNRSFDTQEGRVVLLIRGDLLKKYPTTVIYASKAEWKLEESIWKRKPSFSSDESRRKDPILSGTLPPDITFLGFDLDEVTARGSPQRRDEKPGWFFVLEERVGETRFGADAATDDSEVPGFPTWEDLSWAHLTDAEMLAGSGYVYDLDRSLANQPLPTGSTDEDYTWDSDGATIARITVQRPMRVARHADDMIPEG